MRLTPLLLAPAFVLIAPSFVAAQDVSVEIPTNTILPNYERVPLGQREAIEAGAYLVRAEDALACWYNPAGLAASERTQVSASSNAYEAVSLELFDGRSQKTASDRISPLGAFIGAVIAQPLVSSRRYRFGFSISEPIAWQPGGLNLGADVAPGVKAVLVNHVSLERTEPAASIGYMANEKIRLGASLAVSYLSLSQHQDILVRFTEPQSGETLRRTFVTDGSVYHVLGRFGAQWDITEPLHVGLTFQTPGARLSGSSRLMFASGDYVGSGYTDLAFTESNAEFDYELPLNVSFGAAYEFGRGALEVDVRYYGESDEFELFETDTKGSQTISDATSTTSTDVPFQPTINSWREVVNVSVGGNYRLNDRFRLHAGFNADQSPVADPETSIFRRVDLVGFSTGVSLTMSQFSGALGLGYSSGESDPVTVFVDNEGNPFKTSMSVRSYRVSFAVSFKFGEG
jgi:long-subunit fatty acid transport protein